MTDDPLAGAYRGLPSPAGHLTEEVWERFLDGELDGTGGEAAVDHITRCAECAAVYRGLLAFERESAPLRGRGRPAPRIAAVWRWAAAAAVGAIAILAARMPTGTAPPVRHPSPVATTRLSAAVPTLPVRVAEERAVVYRGRASDSAAFLKAFDAAITPYRRGDYGEAAVRLAGLAARFPDAPEAPLYEGVALLSMGRASEAAERLARAESLATGTEWAPDAEYYAARARLEAGRPQGRATLERLCASSGPYRQASCDAIGWRLPSP
jgi:TolA-binding protein